MGTLASELGPVADRFSPAPRIYADANIPAGLVAFMRARLHWDVLFVVEHDELRRAPDIEHFRLARQLRRTLVTLDRDYLDDRRFPPAECAGVVVVSGPGEQHLARLLSRLDRALFRPRRNRPRRPKPPGSDHRPIGDRPTDQGTIDQQSTTNDQRPRALPLEGRKLHAHPDWMAERPQP